MSLMVRVFSGHDHTSDGIEIELYNRFSYAVLGIVVLQCFVNMTLYPCTSLRYAELEKAQRRQK